MKRWITLLAALVTTFAAFADEQKVYDLDITVTLYSHGIAGIHEVWDLDTGEGITEWYLPRENLGDIEVFNLKVLDEQYNNANAFTDVGEWDVDLSRKQKTGKSGIVHKYNGVELCWGIGEYGHHVFHVFYGMKNVVKSLNDYDMLHMQFVNDEMKSPPQHVRVTIETDQESVKAVLDTANTRIWGFGYEGTVAYQEDGTVVFESSEPFGYYSSVIALLRFDKGIFDSPSVQDRDFQEVLDRALEGADFGPRGDSYDDDEDDDWWASLIAILLMFFGSKKVLNKGMGKVSKREKILFPIIVAIIVSLILPSAATLIGCLMLGNLMKESGVVERLSKAAQNELNNIIVIFLGTTVGATATAEAFLNVQTIKILVFGIIAFGVGTAGGVLLAKFMNLFVKEKINPLIGSAGVSAVPMAARVSQAEGAKANPRNFLLMHAMGPNVAGVIGSAVAAGILLSFLG